MFFFNKTRELGTGGGSSIVCFWLCYDRPLRLAY